MYIYIYIYMHASGAQKFIRDLCVLPVARALLTYCLFAWTSAIYQKLLIVSAAVASVAPSNFTRKPSSKTTAAHNPFRTLSALKTVYTHIYIYIIYKIYNVYAQRCSSIYEITLPKTSTLRDHPHRRESRSRRRRPCGESV